MRVVLSWSSGKDSAWTLYQLQQAVGIEIVGLLTTINSEFRRVAMHAVREELLDMQAKAAGLPLFKIALPWPCSNTDYEQAMQSVFARMKREHDVSHIAYGDLFLDDVRQYRVDLMKHSGIEALFPIWHTPSRELAWEMVASGLSAYLTCVDPKRLSEDFSGSQFDQAFLSLLDDSVDPCGENGEFHTFAYAGPMFNTRLDVVKGETVKRDGFFFTDLMLAN